ncbi:hypothetical protein SARC_09219 [Sphaeroforma arctica JP610]|uniref:S1 motif domain-containing protein n=1 Tax=Sphaeroforma arctica JP610 TaxID=667725 RepID=A0A0L0FPA7_9EUKA|nr:hypothetical protein SARC_09219 [Sphaeroforma arctica JP610]KNC78346.1 hypothetical protein SARC_09219 [Sphaeroforma arctica JP610]|eukprot:XP_014152248.1 hypothetical protein SARC_09219 [Sphaeroforma arctica JP610]
MPALAQPDASNKRIKLESTQDGDFVRGRKGESKPKQSIPEVKKEATSSVALKSLFGQTEPVAVSKAGKKSSGKDAKSKDVKVKKRDKHEKKATTVQQLSIKRLDAGTVCMGQIKYVSDYFVLVTLPSGLSGKVMITDVCSELSAKAAAEADASDSDEEDSDTESMQEDKEKESNLPEMRDLFSLGQMVVCAVKQVVKNVGGGKREINLTVDPATLNRGLKPENVQNGGILSGVVTSIEDHGYLVSFGVDGLKGFMKKTSDTESVKLYAPRKFFVEDMNADGRTATVVLDSLRISSAVARSSGNYTYSTLTAGLLVNAVVSEVLNDGLALTFLGFDGSVDLFHLREVVDPSMLEQKYPVKTKVRARILHINRATKRIGLTLRPDLVGLKATDFAPVEVGQKFDGLTVIRSTSSGLLFKLPEVAGGHYAYAHCTRISDDKDFELAGNKKYKVGRTIPCRVTGFNTIDGVVNVSAQPSVVDQKYYRYEDVKAGMKIEGTVTNISDSSMYIQISKQVRGVCPSSHFADFQLKNPKKKFREGMTIKCKVLSVDCAKQRLVLTHKSTLVKSTLPAITCFEDVTSGLKTAGYIWSVKEHGCLIKFYNNVVGIMPNAELRRAGVTDDMVQGKAIKVIVVRVDSENKKFYLALAPANDETTENVDTDALTKVQTGQIVSGSIIGKTKLGLQVRIHPSNAVAFLPATQLTDHPTHVERLHEHYANVKGDLSKVLVLHKEEATAHAPVRITLSIKPSFLRSVKVVESDDDDESAAKAEVSTLPSSIDQLSVGALVSGYVRSTANYGVFVGFLGDLTGLAGLKDVSDKFVSKTEEHFTVGQSVIAKITKIDTNAGRVNVSLKMSDCATPMTELSHHKNYFTEETLLTNAAYKAMSSEALAVLKEENISGTMSGTVTAVRPFGVIVDLGGGLTGFVTTEQTKGMKSVVAGNDAMGRLLDVDAAKKVVDLTLRPEALASDNGKKLSKKEIAAFHKAVEKHETVAINVELVKEDYLVVTIPKYDSMLGVALVKDYNDTSKPFNIYSIGQKLSAVIISPPAPASTDKKVPCLQRCILRLNVNKEKSAAVAGAHDTVHDSKHRLAEMREGNMVEAVVTKRTGGQLNVDIGAHIKGRVFITDILDDKEALALGTNPTQQYTKGDVIKARVVGFRDQKTYKTLAITQKKTNRTLVELSLRPSVVGDGKDVEPMKMKYTPVRAESLSAGESVVGYVHEVVGDHVWVRLSSDVRARIGVLDCSRDINVLSKLTKHFKDGMPVRCTVTHVNLEKDAVDLTMLDSPTEQAKLEIGTETVGIYRQILANQTAVRVEIPGHKFGLVHVTEMSDEYAEDAFAGIKEGAIVKCVVVGLEEDGRRISLSTRKSALAGDHVEAIEAVDVRIEKASDLAEGQIVRGYVKSISENGCFVWLNRELCARVKIANLSDEFVRDWKTLYPPGKRVTGKVLSVQESPIERVEMSLKATVLDPSLAAAKSASAVTFETLEKGMTVTGTVRAIERYGVFVKIDGGEATRLSGLAHISELSDVSISDVTKVFSIGDAVKAKVLKLDAKKKQMSLGLKASYFADESDSESDTDMEDASDDDNAAAAISDADEDMGEVVQDSDAEVSESEEESEDDSEGQEEEKPKSKGTKRSAKEMTPEVEVDSATALPAVGFGIGFGTTLAQTEVEEDTALPEDADSSDDDSDAEETVKKGASKRQKKRAARDEEELLRKKEAALLDPNATPESANDFERLLMGSPNSSYLWIKYMAMHIGQAEVDKAREVFEQSIKTISYREEREKFNMWKAYMNLEAQYGVDDRALLKAFERANLSNDPKKVHLHLAEIYRTLDGKKDLLFTMYETMVKKFRGSKKMWILYGLDKLKDGDVEATRAILKRALKALPKRKHIATIIKFAQMEFKFGDPERGRTIFEEVLANYPKRVDLWSVYIDMELRVADEAHIRHLFNRITTFNLSTKKMKFFFKRYLEYERTHGTPKTVDAVKDKARAYVESKMQE